MTFYNVIETGQTQNILLVSGRETKSQQYNDFTGEAFRCPMIQPLSAGCLKGSRALNICEHVDLHVVCILILLERCY